MVLVERSTIYKAERLIESCERCNPEGADIPFDHLLDRVTGADPSVADYILEEPKSLRNVRIVGMISWKKR